MSYLQQIAQRNSPMGNQAALLRPQPAHPFAAAGQGTEEGISDLTVLDTPAPPSEPVTIIHSIQQTNLFTRTPDATARAEKPHEEERKQPTYIRSQLERAVVTQPVVTGQIPTVLQPEADRAANQETPEARQVAINWPSAAEPVLPPTLSPLIANKEALQIVNQQILPVTTEEKSMPAAIQLMPLATPQEPSPQKTVAENKLIIGKLTVEIVPPAPPVKTRERVITRIVNAPASHGNSAGRNKLSFGLGQL